MRQRERSLTCRRSIPANGSTPFDLPLVADARLGFFMIIRYQILDI
jgi:hypothetical protein